MLCALKTTVKSVLRKPGALSNGALLSLHLLNFLSAVAASADQPVRVPGSLAKLEQPFNQQRKSEAYDEAGSATLL